MIRLVLMACAGVTLALGLAALADEEVFAAQTETQYVTVDATACVQVSGGPLLRDTNSVQSSSTSAWSIRCPIDLTDSTLGSATITGFAAYGLANSDFATSVSAAVYRRSPTANTSRNTVTSCSMPPGTILNPTSCSSSPSHAVNDNNDAYYIELAVPSSQGTMWELSGARVTYTWSNGP